MNPTPAELESPFPGVIHLRNVQPEDKEKLFAWRNLPGVARHMFTSHVISREEHERWFTDALSNPTRRYWIIVCHEMDAGLVNLYDLDRVNQRCYWACYLASESFRGKGFGALLEFLVLEHVFRDLKLNKLCGEVMAFNAHVLELHKRFGFRQEGVFLQHVFRDGQFHDICCVAMLREEWEQRRAKTAEDLQRIAQRLARRTTYAGTPAPR